MRIRERELKVKLSILIWLILLCLLPLTVARATNTYSACIAFEAIFTPYIDCIIDSYGAPTEPLVSPVIATRNVAGNLSLFTIIVLRFILGLSVNTSTLLEAHENLDSRVKDEPYPTKHDVQWTLLYQGQRQHWTQELQEVSPRSRYMSAQLLEELRNPYQLLEPHERF